MKAVILLLLVGLVSACSYDQGSEWQVTGTTYQGDAGYRITDERYKGALLVLKIDRSLTSGNEMQEALAEVESYIPYHLDNEMGNLFIGVMNVVQTPLIVPLKLVFPSDEGTLGDYFAAMGHNLNAAQANPANDDTVFPTTPVAQATGQTRTSAWMFVKHESFTSLPETSVAVALPDLGLEKTYTTNEAGYVEVDLAPYGDRIEKEKPYKVAITIDGQTVERKIVLDE